MKNIILKTYKMKCTPEQLETIIKLSARVGGLNLQNKMLIKTVAEHIHTISILEDKMQQISNIAND